MIEFHPWYTAGEKIPWLYKWNSKRSYLCTVRQQFFLFKVVCKDLKINDNCCLSDTILIKFI